MRRTVPAGAMGMKGLLQQGWVEMVVGRVQGVGDLVVKVLTAAPLVAAHSCATHHYGFVHEMQSVLQA
jgi:hypothetical protein